MRSSPPILLLSACAAAWLSLAGNGVAQIKPVDSPPISSQPAQPAQAIPLTARFDSKEIKTAAEPGVEVIEMTYEFTNAGELPLVVEEFSRSCGCMVGEWDGVPVEPGTRGKIKAKFLTKGLRGTVRKTLRVTFVESGSVELLCEVKIPEALDYSAQTLSWAIGEAAKPKQVDITIHSKTPLKVLSVSANDPVFSCELQTVKDAGSYKIIITPRDTATERVCVLQVRTDAKDPRDALHGLFALVEKPKPGGGSQ